MDSRKAFDFIQYDILTHKLGQSGPDYGAFRYKPHWKKGFIHRRGWVSFCIILDLVQSHHLGILFRGATYLIGGSRNTFENQTMCQNGDKGK